MHPVSFVLTILLITNIQATPTFTSIYQNYCSSSQVLSSNVNSYQLVTNRNNEVGFNFQITNLVSALNGEGASGIVSDVGGYIIVMAILTFFMILTFIIFLGFCCCCDRPDKTNENCSKFCIFTSIIFLVGFIGLFVAMIVYLGIMNSYLNSAVCAFGRIPYDLLSGASAPAVNFIGFYNMTYIVGNFSAQIGNMNTVNANLLNIYNKQSPIATSAAMSSLSNFYAIYSNSTTSDGSGSRSQPIVIQALTPSINTIISNEFNTYNYTAYQLQAAAQTGLQISVTSSQTSNYQLSLAKINVQLNSIISVLNGNIASITTGIATAVIYLPIGYWITLGFGILVSIFCIILLIWVCMSYRNKKDTCRYCSKLCLVINSLLIIILGLITIALLIVSTVITSTCKEVPIIMSKNGVELISLFTSWGISVDTTTRNILKNCLASDASGSVIAVINSNDPNVTSGVNFLDAIVSFNSIKPNLTFQGTFSTAINATVVYWNNIATGIIADQTVAITNLNQLNGLVSCGSVSYQLNSANCTNRNTCYAIYQSTNSNIPGCASSTTALTIYNNLKQYTIDEFTLLSNMIASLSSTNGTQTPNSAQIAYRQNMISIIPDYNAVVSAVGGFLTSIPVTSGGLLSNLNCTILQNEILNVEAAVCFNFNNPLYYFTALLAFIVFFFFFFSWCICCALRCIPRVTVLDINGNEMQPDTTKFKQDLSDIEAKTLIKIRP